MLMLMLLCAVQAADVAALFEPLERLALLIACLCHDLDHRGAPPLQPPPQPPPPPPPPPLPLAITTTI